MDNYFDDNKNLLKLIFFSILILFFTTKVINANLGHFLAIILIVSSVSYYLSKESESFTEIMQKLEYLRSSRGEPDEEYLYLDSEIIELFYNIKLDLYKYNNRAFEDSLKACNNLLQLRYDSERKLTPRPKPINNNINDLDELKLSIEPDNKFEPLVNGYAVFEAAEIQYKLCINHLHSIVLDLPANPVLRDKINGSLAKMNVLLKRNLDIIYYAYKDSRKIHDRDITHYDLVEPYIPVEKSFNFFV
jgi:hypothetical protein